VYRICGYTILACILVISVVSLPRVKVLVGGLDPIFGWSRSPWSHLEGLGWLRVKRFSRMTNLRAASVSRARMAHSPAQTACAASSQNFAM